jgi:hypothetical protein
MELRLRKNSRGSFVKPRSSRSSTSVPFLGAAVIHSFGVRKWNAGSPKTSGSVYRWEQALGGFRKVHRNSPNIALRHPSFRAYADYMETDLFAFALCELLRQATVSQLAIMCSETVWWRCHRRLISDAALLLHGVTVQHLMHDGKLRAHIPTPGVRTTAERTLRYDVLFETDDAWDERSRKR